MKKAMLFLLLLTACSKTVIISENKQATPPPTPISKKIPSNVLLNGPLVEGGSVSDKFLVTPNKTKVIYIADESIDNVDDIFSVDLSGTNKKNLTNLSIGKKATLFVISPNSQKILFLADINTTGRFDLFVIDIDGTNLRQINLGLSDNSQKVENNFRFSNAGDKIIYVSDEVSTGTRNIYSTNIDGTNRTRLNQVLGTQITFGLANNDSKIVYRTFSANPVIRSVTLSGTSDVLLNSAFNLGLNPASGIQDFKINSDSSFPRVAFRSNQDNGSVFELYIVPIDGSTSPTKVSGSIVSGGIVSSQYGFSNDNQKIVYVADQQTDEVQELFVSNIDGSSNLKLNSTLSPGGDIYSFKFSSDGQKVVYLADQNIDNVKELHSVFLNGLSNQKINTTLSLVENVVDQYLTIGNNVIYAMDKNQSGFYSIYRNDLLGTNEVKISENISSGNGYFDNSVSSIKQFGNLEDNSRIVVIGSSNLSSKNIFSVDFSGNSFKKINETGSISLATNSLGSSFIVVDEYVVYRVYDGIKNQLYIGLAKD